MYSVLKNGHLAAMACLMLAFTAYAGVDDESPMVTAARTRLLSQLQHERPDIRRFELTVIGHPAVPVLAERAAAIVPGGVLSSRKCVWIALGRAGRSAGSMPVWFSVKAFRPVLVAQTSHAARANVNPGDFIVDERDVAMLSGVPLDIDSDVTQMRARRVISAGRIVLKQDLEPLPPILRGQEVSVEIRYGAVDIETQAIALREARFGEPVTLQNPDSRMTYAARVVGQGRAMVVEQ
jgi:flagella basal body P-ring formation protein FlgA